MKKVVFAVIMLLFVAFAGSAATKKLADKTINLGGGSSTHYVEAGKGPVVVLVHGNGGSYKEMLSVLDVMVKLGYHVYAVDSRGQGQNAPLKEYHYADIMEDIYRFIQKKNLKDVNVLGFSDGGIIAIELAMAHPECLHAIATCGANVQPDGVRPDVYQNWLKELEQLKKEGKTLEPLTAMMVDEPKISTEQLAAIKVPALIMAGENDLIAEDHTRHIAASIPGSVLNILPGENHGSYIHNGRAALHFADFLWSIKSSEKTK